MTFGSENDELRTFQLAYLIANKHKLEHRHDLLDIVPVMATYELSISLWLSFLNTGAPRVSVTYNDLKSNSFSLKDHLTVDITSVHPQHKLAFNTQDYHIIENALNANV